MEPFAIAFGLLAIAFAAFWTVSRLRKGDPPGEDPLPPLLAEWGRALGLERRNEATWEGTRGGVPVRLQAAHADRGALGPGSASRRGVEDPVYLLDLRVGSASASLVPELARVWATPAAPPGARPTGDPAFDARLAVVGKEPEALDAQARALLLRGAGAQGVVDLRAFQGTARVLAEWPPEAPPTSDEVAALADAATRVLASERRASPRQP